MQAVTTIGLDIAKSVFQVHGIDAEGSMLMPSPSTSGMRVSMGTSGTERRRADMGPPCAPAMPMPLRVR